MKWFRNRLPRIVVVAGVLLAAFVSMAAIRPLIHIHSLLFAPGHGVARWIDNVSSGSDVEKALYRLMDLPGGSILFRRTPRESIPAITQLQQTQNTAALYSLRALEEEQALDFAAAERDWKAWADGADDRPGAHLDLADFYERRLQPQAELSALEFVGNAPADSSERWAAVDAQRSWRAFERALKVVSEYALPRTESARIYSTWMKRYPQESSLYERQFAFLLAGKDFPAATALIAQYRIVFPEDRVFPVKAEADLAVRRGQPQDGLAVYEERFEPLWPAELIKSYYALVLSSHNQRAFSDALRARLAANPDDLKDAARLFYLYQQLGQLDSAKAVLTRFRESKESRGAKWTPDDLNTLEKLFEAMQDFPEAARYAYALASDRGSPNSERTGVVALARILLTAPEQPLRVGAGNLALYRSIATMDRGPGYLNGILSLFLNTAGPGNEYATEDQLAAPYFHRARAAELLAQIDQRFPDEAARPRLHASLMEAYSVYGENPAVIREGTAILAQFPQFSGRVSVAMRLADAYERTQQVDKEFALYQDLLKELAAKSDGVPLGAPGDTYSKSVPTGSAPVITGPQVSIGSGAAAEDDTATGQAAPAKAMARSAEYAQVLDRYLTRLVSLHRLPDALAVLRGELDRNPQDPGLYERLADFLQQNALNAHEEEVFQRAIQQFQDTGWYAKLARFYLRQRRNADYTALMHKVADIFSGTDLEQFLSQAPAPNASLSFEVDRYASERFPHDLRFVERMAATYMGSHDDAALEKLLWQHWYESPDLRSRLFEILSSSRRLDSTLATLRQQAPELDKADWDGLAARNPAAERFWLEACLWQSHYEQGVDAANALAAAYPADATLGEQASSLYRSLAYFHPEDTDKAVAIQKHLLEANPGNLDTLARIGDIYADRERFGDAAPYWVRMANVHPGESNGYLQSATVFWDYFDFGSAQKQLDSARERLAQPTLFGYQSGAIAESRGDLPAAVRAYTASAITDDPSAESRDRLLVLARRPALRAQVEQGTGALLNQSTPSPYAIQLRAGILEAEHRKDDLSRELNQLTAQTGSFDVLEAISSTARSHLLPDVEQSALRRQIALTTDPVRSIQLRYELVALLQQRSPSAAAQEADAIYRDHARILGVVRSTVDFDWNHNRKQQAVTVLLDSAQAAYPELKSGFQLEAARKLTSEGDYARSRTLLTTLLAEKPLDAEYESAMADNLARANDSAGLENFYRTQLDLVRKAALGSDQKQQRMGQLRRGIIAASTQLGNSSEAIDQYIELINAFPDDASLAEEAAIYAVVHNARDRLFAFYQKTINDSPRDPRWSIVLARLATAAEDDALAIDAYSKALRLRPERQDLYIAQATLQERLHRFDDAIALYRKLYTLSYRDPHWMEKVAELSAREGHNAAAVKALETGWTEGRPPKAANFFAVADRLEKWNLLDEAQRFAEQGVQQSGADFLIAEPAGAATYARILTRKRQTEAAFVRLASAREEAPKLTVATVAQQVVKQGVGAITDAEWRKQREQERRSQASAGFTAALNAMAAAVAEFYAPEEKSKFASMLRQHASGASAVELANVYLPAARAAELADVTADLQWTFSLESGQHGDAQISSWLQLQRQRVQLDAAAVLMEKTAASIALKRRDQILRDAAATYRDSGDTVSELRMTERLYQSQHMDSEALNRYYRLLLAQRPDSLIRIATKQDSAANYLVRSGNSAQALSAITARATDQPSVWHDAYLALTGFYRREYRPEIAGAFNTALNADATIGDRIGQPIDRNRHLAGDVWFYYGSRYAEYLDGAGDPRSEDFLPSELEHTPGNAAAYRRLADYLADTKHTEASLADYQHTLDLNPDQPAVLDSIAVLQWNAGHHAEAIAAWSEAVNRLAQEMDARRVPETFWSDFDRVFTSITAHKQYDSVREAADAMLRIYVARNGNYRVEPLLQAAYRANGNSVEWLLNITANAANQATVLYAILPNSWSDQGKWIEKDQLDRIYARILEIEVRDARNNQSESYDSTDSPRHHLVEALIDETKIAEARAQIAEVPQPRRNSPGWLPLVLRVAQADGTLAPLVASWTSQPASAPADDVLRGTATALDDAGRRAVLRFVYQRALDRRELTAPNFLGLAGIELDEHNTAAAIALLKRMTLVSANMYADSDAAAQLLQDRNLPSEALEFLRPLVNASPWDPRYKVRQAKVMLAINANQTEALALLRSVAASAEAPYSVRVSAAEALHGHGAPAAGEELELIAQSGCPQSEAALKPYFVAARLRVAECTANLQTKEHLLREAVGTAPNDMRVRLPYIFAAFEAGFDSRALIASELFLDPANHYGANYGPQYDNVPSLAALKKNEAERLIRYALAAYQRRRDLAAASRMATMALEFTDDSSERKALQDRAQRFEHDLARAQQNNARAPNIRPELDQPAIVRPLLRAEDPLPSSPRFLFAEDQR